MLDGPFERLLALLESEDERATRLRQSSPFCGIVTPDERRAILKRFAAYDTRPT